VNEALLVSFDCIKKRQSSLARIAEMGVRWELDIGAGLGVRQFERSCTVAAADLAHLVKLGIDLRVSVYLEDDESEQDGS
jgi:hypothetical protein